MSHNITSENRLAAFVWSNLQAGERFVDVGGQQIVVQGVGTSTDIDSVNYFNATLQIEGTTYRGDILLETPMGGFFDNVILQVVLAPAPAVFNSLGERIPQLILPVDASLVDLLSSLIASSRSKQRVCGDFLRTLEPFRYAQFMSELLSERLETKCAEVDMYYDQSEQNWHQCFHLMFFRVMGTPKNKAPFLHLARMIPYDVFLHERDNLEMLEALLYGSSGLLSIKDDRHEYVRVLKGNFDHIRAKYHFIKPLKPGQWNMNSSDFNGMPVIRLMQSAAFIHDHDIIFDNIVKIKTLEDVYKLFSAETSEFWRVNSSTPQRIGKDRQDVLAINLVAPLMMSYARKMDLSAMRDDALELLYQTPAERNLIITSWAKAGVICANAADTQALIQLTNEYCSKGKCAQCRIGREQIKQKYACLSK